MPMIIRPAFLELANDPDRCKKKKKKKTVTEQPRDRKERSEQARTARREVIAHEE